MGMKEEAVAYFEQGYVCSQAILAAYGTKLGLERETAFRLAGPFGAGMGRMGFTCGAVAGAFMVIGLKYGTADLENTEDKEKAYGMVRAFTERFVKRHGTMVCRELIDCDISTPQGLQHARDTNLFGTVCVNLVRDAADLLEDIFLEQNK
jgi:C_GCAxxG_C_C family probable redox protein